MGDMNVKYVERRTYEMENNDINNRSNDDD